MGVWRVAGDIACKSPPSLARPEVVIIAVPSEGKLRVPTWARVILPGNCFALTKQVNKHFCAVCSGPLESNTSNCTNVALFVSL
jgi:hypothetical protein